MPMEWVGPLISGAAVVLVAIIEAVAARERKRIKSDNQKSDALMNGVQALLRREIIAEYNHYSEQRYIPIYGMENVLDMYNAYKELGGNGMAAKLVEADHYGVAVAMKNNIVTENALKDIAGKTKLVPETCDMLTVARRMGVSLG